MLSVSQYAQYPYQQFPYSVMDGGSHTHTINPAELNTLDLQNDLARVGSKGTKRDRSLDNSTTLLLAETGTENNANPRKRSRPSRTESANTAAMMASPIAPVSGRLSHIDTSQDVQDSPPQVSPPANTSTIVKTPVVKAFPTVRDHTTDQLNEEGDEYIVKERDEAGELKVDVNGYLTGREYKMRTFNLPGRGQRLFMLATECARVLNYRDSYLLFNKNRSLYKIIATQEEKDNLIAQEMLPYSYRSRQIAMATARSMFRQFGSRAISNGRRVRDDYWEAKARTQGFTEEDAAGEKRPGAARQREAALAQVQANTLAALPHGQIVYNTMGLENQPPVPAGIHPVTFATLPMINDTPADDSYLQNYPQVLRPRQEHNGPAYEDQTRESNTVDVASQAASSAEFNRQLTQQRSIRSTYLDDYWKRSHEATPSPVYSTTAELPGVAATLPHLQSPQLNSMAGISAPLQAMSQQSGTHILAQQGYGPQSQHQSGMLTRSPVRPMHQSLPPSQLQHGSPGLGLSQLPGRQQASYSYSSGGMWPPPQPQQSPLQMQTYGQHHAPQSQQSTMQPPAQQPRQVGNMAFSPMGNPAAFGQINRNLYQQTPGVPQFSQQAQQQQQHQAQQQQMYAGLPNWAQNQSAPNLNGHGHSHSQGQNSSAHGQAGLPGQEWQRGFQ